LRERFPDVSEATLKVGLSWPLDLLRGVLDLLSQDRLFSPRLPLAGSACR